MTYLHGNKLTNNQKIELLKKNAASARSIKITNLLTYVAFKCRCGQQSRSNMSMSYTRYSRARPDFPTIDQKVKQLYSPLVFRRQLLTVLDLLASFYKMDGHKRDKSFPQIFAFFWLPFLAFGSQAAPNPWSNLQIFSSEVTFSSCYK